MERERGTKMYLKTNTLPDAWFQAIWNLLEWDEEKDCLRNGVLYKIDQGSYEKSWRLEYPFITIEVEHPTYEPLLPESPENLGLPSVASMEYVYDYFNNYLMSDIVPKNTCYTYGSRIAKVLDEENDIQQLDLLCDRLEAHPHSNQLILQIAEPGDLLLEDPPCLRSVLFKVIGNRLDFHIYFRSNDLVNGFPVNMASLALLMKYLKVLYPQFECGKFIYFGSGLHVYDHAIEFICQRCYRMDLYEKLKLLIK